MSSLFMNTVLLPFAYFFYETDESRDYKTRFCTAFRNWVGILVIFCLIHFPMFVSLRHAHIPVESESYKGLEGTP
jgi:fumarate reductase subunit D